MKKIIKIFLLSGLLLSGHNLFAQNQREIRINEFLVINKDDFEDDFGHKSGWIELFNSSYGTINIGGCYLTNDPNNLTKYIIPKGDATTKIKPRQHVLFWADNQPFRGTYHINFTLTESNEILFVSSDGKTIIDRIKINHSQLDTNVSFGRINDGIGSTDGNGDGWGILERTSPSTINSGAEKEPASVVFKKADPYGVIMAFTAMSVVFLALILLYVAFKFVGNNSIRRNKQRAVETAEKEGVEITSQEDSNAEQLAAIAAALHTYLEESEVHDLENTILTISKVTKHYSPWSSKIYTLRETPQKK